MTEDKAVQPAQTTVVVPMIGEQKTTLTVGGTLVDVAQALAGGGIATGAGLVAREWLRQRGENHRAEVNAARDIAIEQIRAGADKPQ